MKNSLTIDAMDGPLVFFCVGRAHQKVAGGNARQVRRRRMSSSSASGAARVIVALASMHAGAKPVRIDYSLRHETRTVCDGTDAVHLREPGGVQPVGERRASAALGELVDDDAVARRAARREPCATRRSNGTRAAARGDRRALSGRDARPRAGDQRRIRSELHHDVESRRAGRRGRDDGAELHADLGPGARVRRDDPRLAAGRTIAAADGASISTRSSVWSRRARS